MSLYLFKTTRTFKLQSDHRRHQNTNTNFFFAGWMPFLPATNSKALKDNNHLVPVFQYSRKAWKNTNQCADCLLINCS